MVAGAAVLRAVVTGAAAVEAAVVARAAVVGAAVAGAAVVAAAVRSAWQPHTRQPHASVRKYFTVPGPQLQLVVASGAHTAAGAVVGFTVNGAMVVVAAATHVHVRHPLLSVVHVGVSVVRKHWHGWAAGQVAGATVATVVARAVVGAAVAEPHVHELGQPLASVAHVMATPASQPQAGRGPQRAVVGATVVVAAAVVARAAVVVAARVVAAAVGAAVVAAATVVAAAPELPVLLQ